MIGSKVSTPNAALAMAMAIHQVELGVDDKSGSIARIVLDLVSLLRSPSQQNQNYKIHIPCRKKHSNHRPFSGF